MRIFLIEDDPDFRVILKTFLEMKDHEVISSDEPTGCPAYGTVDEPCMHEHPCGDILLADNHLPNMTGLEFIETQLERGCKGSIRNKAIMSADLSEVERQRATQLGCTIFTKPFSLLTVLEWLESVESRLAPDRKLHDFAA